MWITVDEDLPNTNQTVLICYKAFGEYFYTEGKYIGYDNVFETKDGLKSPMYWNPDVPNKNINLTW